MATKRGEYAECSVGPFPHIDLYEAKRFHLPKTNVVSHFNDGPASVLNIKSFQPFVFYNVLHRRCIKPRGGFLSFGQILNYFDASVDKSMNRIKESNRLIESMNRMKESNQ